MGFPDSSQEDSSISEQKAR